MKAGLTVAAVLLSLSGPIAHAGEIREGSVVRAGEVYTVTFDAVISVSPSRVYELMTDYDHLSQLSNSILESDIIKKIDDHHHITRLLLHTCILFFCQNMVLIENVSTNGRNEIQAVVIPEGSDFRQGMSHWSISPFGVEQAQLTLHRKLEPAFWIPPVIGPWLVRKKMLQELSVLIERLEDNVSQEIPHG